MTHSVADLRQRFGSGELRPSEYLDQSIARIERLDGRLNTLVARNFDAAREEAKAADEAFRAGRPRGPLEGVPVGIKDVLDVAGLPTTCHSKVLLDNIAGQDAAAVAALRKAGAIVIGKTATHEFAIGGPAFDLPFPPARNPWNVDHHPGGSSSGSAAGVAAGLFPAAIGTDTGGSVRHPASACGIVGLKPTYDAISRAGVFPLSWTLDHVGSLARTVADAALLCDVMAAGRTAAARDLGQPIRGLRVGFVRHFHLNDMPATAEMSAALEDGAARLKDAGAIVEEVALPDLRSFFACNRIILASEALAIHGQWLRDRPEDYCSLSRRGILLAAFLSAEDLVNAQRKRAQLVEAVSAAMQSVDVLLTASSMELPCRIDDPAEVERSYGRQARTPFNLTGHPAITLRSGMSASGLPLSMQIAGRTGDEATVCRVAAAIELPLQHPELA